MEQQKTLWIVFSVALFLLVVVVVGFIWFLPSDDGTAKPDVDQAILIEDNTGIGEYDPIEWVRETQEVPGIEAAEGEEPQEDILLVYGESEEATAESETEVPAEVVSVVRVAEPAPKVTAPAAVKPDTPATPVKPKTVQVTQYWIQAGSFKSRSRAEDSQRTLADKGWNARIISRDVNSDTYFRVRLGPYTNPSEARKFLDWIREIDSYEASYISQVYTTTTLN